MIPCAICRFWYENLCRHEGYGECKNQEQINKMIQEARHAYRFNERQQYAIEKLYRPYYTAKDHRCIFGKAAE